MKHKSLGGAKFWLLFVDEYKGFKKSYFLCTKNQATEKGLEFIHLLQSNNIKVKVFRCDNAAENEKLKEKITELSMDACFESSAPGTPQQNGVVERAFAVLYSRVQAILNYAKIEGEIRKLLWVECAKTTTDWDGILYGKEQTENSYTKKFRRNPGFIKHLRIFGETVFVLIHCQIDFKSQISGKGKDAFFVGYTTEHAADIYCMYDPNTKKIKISCDVRWMGKFYNDGHPIEIPNYNENNSRNMKSVPPPIRYNDTEKESNWMKQSLNEKNVPENPTTNNVAEVVLVWGTDESYKSPDRFNDTWYNKNPK